MFEGKTTVYFNLKLTFDTFAALFEGADVGVDATIASDLISGEVGIVGRRDEVMRQRLAHVMVAQRCH